MRIEFGKLAVDRGLQTTHFNHDDPVRFQSRCGLGQQLPNNYQSIRTTIMRHPRFGREFGSLRVDVRARFIWRIAQNDILLRAGRIIEYVAAMNAHPIRQTMLTEIDLRHRQRVS